MEEVLGFLSRAWQALPRPVAAVVILAAGWLVAKAARFLVGGLFRLARFDAMSAKTGFSEFLRKGHVGYAPSKLMGTLAYWIVLMLVFLRSARELDDALFTTLTGHLADLVPSILAGVLVLVIGAILMGFTSNFVLTLARNAGMPNANLLSRSIKYAGNALIAAIAFEQMGLGQTIISSMFLVFLAAAAFGTALAFGLGCKDLARDAMIRFIGMLKERGRESKGTDLEG